MVLAVAAGLGIQVASVFGSSGPPPVIRTIAAGGSHTCAVTSAGGVKCWGSNYSGQLGNGTTTDSPTTVDASGLARGIVSIAAGYSHSCALLGDGRVKCWGSNSYGQLGTGTATDPLAPADVAGLGSGVIAIAAGEFHTCALTRGGGVKCWGHNSSGQLGNGIRTRDSTTPLEVSGLANGVSAIAAGDDHTCAVLRAGGVTCWGANYDGQLGNGTMTDSLTPVDVLGLAAPASAVAAGRFHTCAMTAQRQVQCWGANDYGELGDGSFSASAAPEDVSGLMGGVVAIAAGGLDTCALMSNDGVKCWGQNEYAQLGNGSTIDSPTPVDVSRLARGVIAIDVGSSHACAVMSAGGVKCWGAGGLGGGASAAGLVPMDVVFSSQAPPATEAADPSASSRGPDYPLFPLLAGLSAAFAVSARRGKPSP